MTEQRLDVHYQSITEDGNLLRLTVYGVEPPLKTDPYNIGTEEKPVWVEFVCGHTARHNADDGDTARCFPFDPEFDDCPNDSDGDGDCALCVRRPEGCLYRSEEPDDGE